jgi:hypothetical protein
MSIIEREAVVCRRCSQVIAIDGENNLDRIGSVCSHLGPFVQVVPHDRLQGAAARIEVAEKVIRKLVAQLEPTTDYDDGEAVTAALHWLRGGGSR